MVPDFGEHPVGGTCSSSTTAAPTCCCHQHLEESPLQAAGTALLFLLEDGLALQQMAHTQHHRKYKHDI